MFFFFNHTLFSLSYRIPICTTQYIVIRVSHCIPKKIFASCANGTHQLTVCSPTHLFVLQLEYVCGCPLNRRDLEHLPLERFSLAFILHEAKHDNEDTRTADGRALTILFLLRDIREHRVGQKPMPIVTEVSPGTCSRGRGF